MSEDLRRGLSKILTIRRKSNRNSHCSNVWNRKRREVTCKLQSTEMIINSIQVNVPRLFLHSIYIKYSSLVSHVFSFHRLQNAELKYQ